ncbi:transposon Ty3-G Gag-Pol polyprotein [Trichonephila clavipes]|nr:transposon Ty3-G Gag-Pol polyprotein [Trichonephila clavipes]
MRSALKDDINATCAQLVYGTTLRLPSDLVTSDSINQTANSTYVTSLIQTMRSLNPVSTAQHGTQNIYINLSLKTCSHIFLRSDKVNPPLTPPYTGPHLVISRNDKNFIIDLNGKQSTVSIDRLKPAYLLADVTDHSDLVQTQTIIEKPVTAAPNPSIPYTTRYGRKERRAEETEEQRSHRLSTMAQHARRRRVNVTEKQNCLRVQTFYAARTFLYPVVEEHNCSKMENICLKCGGLYFGAEKNGRGAYTHCCHNGKIIEKASTYPVEMKGLMNGSHDL